MNNHTDCIERIEELEASESALSDEVAQLGRALVNIADALFELQKYADSAAHMHDPLPVFKDLAPWRNIMAANGYKQDGTPIKARKLKSENIKK